MMVCGPAGGSSRSLPAFPPHTFADMQRLVQSLAPIDIPSTASDMHAARVPRRYATYTSLFSYFFAYRCSPEEAAQTIRTDSPLDNSITLDPLWVTVTNDPTTGTDRPVIIPSSFPASPVFRDIFYEHHDLSDWSLLSIRVGDAPGWFTPQAMRSGIADRCLWKRGEIQVEFYCDADRKMMFLRFDGLRRE